jgi:NAD(P)-dependent dehydrogenase (short-subunit alcohol dehydrogenase family)
MNKLEGKIALITGGNSGIGLATAMQFVNEGAHVFITGRRDPELAAAVREIGRNVTGVQGDVSNLGDLDRLFARIKQEKGKLDIVFANAGMAKYAALGKITEDPAPNRFRICLLMVLPLSAMHLTNNFRGVIDFITPLACVVAHRDLSRSR